MKYNVNFSQIVSQLVKVFKSEQTTRDYNIEGEIFEGMCGWCGVMSPVSRGAFVKAFGASVMLEAETKAREEIQAAQDRHNATRYHAHAIEADQLQGVPAVGGFFWAANSGMKCDDGRGVFGEISALLWCTEEDDEHSRQEFAKLPARLCQVREVFTVSPEEFDRPDLADELVTRHALQGGSASDDVDEGTTWQQLANDEEALATLYTFGALVTDGTRYYLIDTEGYSYSRYIYVPLSWQDNLGGIVKSERERIQARKEAEARQEEEEKAARLSEYKNRCTKWAHLMEDVRPLEQKEAEAYEAYTRTGWKRHSLEGKAHTAAKRATDAARKRNILAMCSAAFPGVKFSVSVHRGWGEDFRVTWQDGPTEAEFKEVSDLDLFASCWDTFDGMTDCADIAHAEFTDFSSFAMGDRCGGCVKADREISEQTLAAVIAELVAVVPEYDSRDTYGYNRVQVTAEQAAAVAQRLGMSVSALYSCGYALAYDASADEIAHRYCVRTSFYKQQGSPTDPDPNRSKRGEKVHDEANDDAPADGLELVEIPGGMAVVGDARTTYRNRREIKAHGGTWNKTAQRWEATEPEKVVQLRAWFAHDEQSAEATAEASTGADTEAGAPVEGQGVEATAEASTETGTPSEGQAWAIKAEQVAEIEHKPAPCPELPETDEHGERIAWQYVSNGGEQLHEIRRHADGFYYIVWGIGAEDGCSFDPTRHKTHADALATLQHYRPQVEAVDPQTTPAPANIKAEAEEAQESTNTAAPANIKAEEGKAVESTTEEAQEEADTEATIAEGRGWAKSEVVACGSSHYSACEKSPNFEPSGVGSPSVPSFPCWGVFMFGDVDGNSYEPQMIKSFDSEAQAREWLRLCADCASALSADHILACTGGYWVVWYDRDCSGYYCQFVAHRADAHDLSGALLRCESLHLRRRVHEFKRKHIARQMAEEAAPRA